MKCHGCKSVGGSAYVQIVLKIMIVLISVNCYNAQDQDTNYRLPNQTYPLKYNIELTTRIHDNTIGDSRFHFEGKVIIQLMAIGDPDATTNEITVNYRQINITHVKLWYIMQNDWEITILDDATSFTVDPLREFVTIHSPQPLNGTYFLELKYNGILREDNGGFYRSSYRDDNGIVKWLATTQFSPTDARHAFPCYDEPGIRAPIALRVIHGKEYSVLSNTMPIDVRESIWEGMAITTFPDTPKMPSYLLGIIVSDFTEINQPNFPRQLAYTRPTALSLPVANFIIEAGFKILAALEDFLQTSYILAKLSHVAIPDFSPGAMENYGIITYKEENFMFHSQIYPMKQKKKIATIVAHEIGHHYFGNYVSPAWWSYLWMKEGFARFFEYTAAQMVFPEMEIEKMYTIDKTHNVFQLDSLSSSRPMTYYVNTQSEISNIFDDIAYDKGGAVLLMFYYTFGKEPFRNAMIHYLHANALQTGSPEKFAAAMQIAIFDSLTSDNLQFNASLLLQSWTEQAGYPILHISRFGDDCSLRIEQQRYLLKTNDTSNLIAKWIIPYNFATEKNPSFENTTYTGWITEQSHTIKPTNDLNWTCDEWIVFNKQQTSYYRINYDSDLWHLISAALLRNRTIIHENNRAQLIDDALNNARSGRLLYIVPLQLLRYLSNEIDYIPWAAADRNLGLLNVLMRGTNKYDIWQKYCLEFVEPIYIRMGITSLDQDTLAQRLTREIVVNWACKVGSRSCLNHTAFLVKEIAEDRLKDADPDLREPIFCNGLRNASLTVFDSIWQRMQASQDQSYRSELIRSLGCVEKESLVNKYLDSTISLNGTNYFNQERERVFMAVYKNGDLSMEIAMKFLLVNMDQVNLLYNKGNFGGRAISSIVRNMAQHITSEDMHTQLQDLMEKLLEKGLLRASDMLQALEYSSENLMWIHERGAQISNWLEEQYPAQTQSPTTITTTLKDSPSDTITQTTRMTPTDTTTTNVTSNDLLETFTTLYITTSAFIPTFSITPMNNPLQTNNSTKVDTVTNYSTPSTNLITSTENYGNNNSVRLVLGVFYSCFLIAFNVILSARIL
ncbi:aminopeptidase N-like [Anopheles marshallii]|uniref:aminopeptidase N-like n=1 Tax=Anopheles marshallii TaxID=1521116 RepID=UPI00237ACABE|nr:aminopeptidase N-like [Anopheles marshallii]